ncbi:MAG: homoserine dehydrogenase [Candidatus Aminicenantes bacterium]
MLKINLILMGFGNVGKAFLNLLRQKENFCKNRYGLDLSFAGIFRSREALVFPLPQKAGFIADKMSWQKRGALEEVLDNFDPGVLVECTPTDSRTGGPGLEHIHLALDSGWNVVTANKGPLVVAYSPLMEKARQNDLALKISGATAAALPTIDVALQSLAGSEISRIEGILNGTTNYILTRMGEEFDFKTALNEAQAKGIAETEPSLDVEGWDTAFKILLLTNAVFNTSFVLDDVKVEGITKVDPSFALENRKKGKKLKLLGGMTRRGEEFSMGVTLTAVGSSHPLFNVDYTEKGVTFETDTMSTITVIGGKSDPTGTAAAMLKDVINIYAL